MGPKGYRLKPRTWALLICLLGFALLIYELDNKSLYADESFEVEAARDLRSIASSVSLMQPPLRLLPIWLLKIFVGNSEFALRFSSVVFGMLSLAMVYPFGRKMMTGEVALLAMGLMAMSPFFVLISRMARYYSLVLFLSLVSYWFFSRLLQGHNTLEKWVGYGVSSTLAMYTHILFPAVLAAQAAVVLLQSGHRREFILRFFGTQILILFCAPHLWMTIPGVWTQRLAAISALPDAFAGSALAMWMLSAVYPLYVWLVGETIYPWNPAAVAGIVVAAWLAGRGLLSVIPGSPHALEGIAEAERTEARPLSLWLRLRSLGTTKSLALPVFILLPLSVSIVASRRSTGAIFQTGIAVFCAPFMYLLLATGIWTITRPRLRLLAVAILSLVLGLSLANYYLGREFLNPLVVLPSKGVAKVIGEQSQSGDLYVSDRMTGVGYYLKQDSPQALHFLAQDAGTAKSYMEQHHPTRVWLTLLCRAVEWESPASVELVPWLVNEGYILDLALRYAPQDADYMRVQELILGRPACEYKVSVYRYARPQ